METDELADRLSQIRTQWSAVFDAHGGTSGAGDVRGQLVQRYTGAVYRYLLGAVRDADQAADLCQEFAVRFLRGDLRAADPARGRFRDYVRTVLINLVNDVHRAKAASPAHLSGEQTPAPTEVFGDTQAQFNAHWRADLIARTWDSLGRENPAYHSVLWLRVAEPDLTSAQLAERLSAQVDKPMTAANVRKTLERAHEKFARLLFDEVAVSLGTADLDAMEAELRELDLLRYCRTAWERMKSAASKPSFPVARQQPGQPGES